jgi:hypothetical protein
MGFCEPTCQKERITPFLVCSLPHGLEVPPEELIKMWLGMESILVE